MTDLDKKLKRWWSQVWCLHYWRETGHIDPMRHVSKVAMEYECLKCSKKKFFFDMPISYIEWETMNNPTDNTQPDHIVGRNEMVVDNNQASEEPRDLIQICTDIYYECETIKRLDELTDEALDWHNKQVEAVLDRIEVAIKEGGYDASYELSCIEAERKKLDRN